MISTPTHRERLRGSAGANAEEPFTPSVQRHKHGCERQAPARKRSPMVSSTNQPRKDMEKKQKAVKFFGITEIDLTQIVAQEILRLCEGGRIGVALFINGEETKWLISGICSQEILTVFPLQMMNVKIEEFLKNHIHPLVKSGDVASLSKQYNEWFDSVKGCEAASICESKD